MAGRPEQNRGDWVGGGRGGAHAQQKRKGSRRIQVVGEGQQQRQAGNPADSREDAQGEPHAHPAEEIRQPYGIKNDKQGSACRLKHVRFHDRPLTGILQSFS